MMLNLMRQTLSSTPKWASALNPTRSLSSTAILRDTSSGSKETHTGQQWDESDFRNFRFLNTEKEINEKFAIDLVSKVPPIEVTERIVACDGGGGPLGHPRVFINLDDGEPSACIYCRLRYVLKSSH
uniref:NADH dehydrogenase iron-sulfur protein 6, mitochondrial n=1 Tax=Lepeophtheirus salmonis TaxID=72036 RepID=D3PGA7_LEPSM|nr:NADH dehydrogenase iron-sulfur protein 6, mitochondrial [Lepeophtheirus salmonis]